MTKSKLLILAAAPALLLCSCAKKCSYEDFVKAVEEIQIPEKLDIEKVKISYDIDMEGDEFDVKGSKTFEGGIVEIEKAITALAITDFTAAMYCEAILGMNVVEFALKGEQEGYTYYAGSTFKIKMEDDNEKGVAKFDKYGMCTLMESESDEGSVEIKASYTYND